MNLDDTLQVEQNVKQSGSSFYWGMKLLPKEKRRGMFAIYAFCREVDDIADDLTWKSRQNFTLRHFMERINIYNEEEFDYQIKNLPIES